MFYRNPIYNLDFSQKSMSPFFDCISRLKEIDFFFLVNNIINYAMGCFTHSPTILPMLSQSVPNITTLEEIHFILRRIVVLFHPKKDIFQLLLVNNINMIL